MPDKKTEIKKTITKKNNGNVISNLETTITVPSSCSWHNLKFCRLHSRIVNAYLEAIDLAKDDFIEEKVVTTTSKTDATAKDSQPPKTNKTEETTKYRDNLKHYENLYRCYIE